MSHPRSPVFNVRIFSYATGIPDLGDMNGLDWRFEDRDGTAGLTIDEPCIVVCHPLGGPAYRRWITWVIAQMDRDPPVPTGLLFISSEPQAARHAIASASAQILAGAPGKLSANQKILDSHIHVFPQPLPSAEFGPTSRVAREFRKSLDEFITWIKDRTRLPREDEFHKVWDLLERSQQQAKQELIWFMETATCAVVSDLFDEQRAKDWRLRFNIIDEGPAYALEQFSTLDDENFTQYYPLDIARQSIRHTWIKHKFTMILGHVDEISENERKILRQGWSDLAPRLDKFVSSARMTFRSDPVLRAVSYLCVTENDDLELAIKRLRDAYEDYDLLIARGIDLLSRTPIAPESEAVLCRIEESAAALEAAMTEDTSRSRLLSCVDALDKAVEATKVRPEVAL